jgi:hypothetical protein
MTRACRALVPERTVVISAISSHQVEGIETSEKKTTRHVRLPVQLQMQP